MVISKEYSTDLRLLLPEVIWLEPEYFQQATQISSQMENEPQQWQTYLNILARSSLSQWLKERIADKPINIESNVTESICYLKLGEFRLGVVAQEHFLDEVVSISQEAIARPESAAHFYVILEVDEEQEQAILRGFLRHDELIKYRSQVNLQPSKNGDYRLPLSLFDAEPNHLLFYSRHLEPTAIPLPPVAAESVQDSLKKTFSSSRTKLSQWLQGVLEEGWLSFEELVTPEANLAWSTRSVSEKIRKGKLINLGIQLENQTVALLITVTPESEEVRILVQLYPTGGERYLPANLQLTLLNKAEKILQSTQSRSQDNYIQLKSFKGKPGIRFGIEVSMGNVSVREYFEL
jgi:hypothetical protein